MRLVFNGRFLAARQSGVQRVARRLIGALARKRAADPDLAGRLHLRLVAPSSAAAADPVPGVATQTGGRLGGQPWEQVELPGLVRRGETLVGLCNLAPIATRSVVMIHDAQVFSSPASYSPAFRAWYRFAQPLIARRSLRVLTVSEFSRAELVHYGVAPAERIGVVHNGVDHLLEAAPDPSAVDGLAAEGRPFVAAPASVQAHKNLTVLLTAFARPELADVLLALYGADDEAAFRAAGHDVPPNVRFLGRLSDGALRCVMERALAFAFPSRTEGFGLPPLEAMTLGAPALLSMAGALREVGGVVSTHLPDDDPAEWAAEIARRAGEPAERRAARGAEAKAHAAHFTWERAATAFLGEMETVLGPLR